MARDRYKIVVMFDPPPIPVRSFDWSAVEDDYEPGCPIGFGTLRETAVLDLMQQLDDEE